ncbi:MAG TPA: sulfotransferase [Phycisphaerae bacterium]|nr:sulfotransferase [Phycisphaerae bacterium]
MSAVASRAEHSGQLQDINPLSFPKLPGLSTEAGRKAAGDAESPAAPAAAQPATCFCVSDGLPGAERAVVVRYEDLVQDPLHWLRTIYHDCGLPFDERTLDHRQRPTAFGGVGAPEVLKRPAKPVHSRSIGRGRKLTPPQREIVRQICGPGALELGYSL